MATRSGGENLASLPGFLAAAFATVLAVTSSLMMSAIALEPSRLLGAVVLAGALRHRPWSCHASPSKRWRWRRHGVIPVHLELVLALSVAVAGAAALRAAPAVAAGHRPVMAIVPPRPHSSSRAASSRAEGARDVRLGRAATGPGGGIRNMWDFFVMRWFRLDTPKPSTMSKSGKETEDFGQDLAMLWRFALVERRLLSVGISFLLVAAGLRTLIPQAVAKTLVAAVEQVGKAEGAAQGLQAAAKRLGVLALGYGCMSGLRGLTMSIVENRLLSRLRTKTFSRMLQQDVTFHDSRSVGELTSRLNSDCEAVSSGLSLNFNVFLRSAVQLIFGVGYLTWTSWRLSLLLVVVWGLLFYVYNIYGKFTRRSSQLRQDALADLSTVATESLQNVRTVRALGIEGTMLTKYREASEELIFLEHQRAAAYGIYATFYNGLTEAIKAVALGGGGVLVARGAITPEQLTASMLYVEMVVGSSLTVGGQYRQLMQSIGSSRRVFEYTEMEPAPSVRGEGEQLPASAFHGAVRFHNVTFAYPTRHDKLILQGLTVDLNPGETTAIVGASGSGKSTLAALLQRWYEPDSGTVFVDGTPLPDLDPQWLRSKLGVVNQDPHLFSATVFENILIGVGDRKPIDVDTKDPLDNKPEHEPIDVDTKESLLPLVHAAAKAASMHDFIEGLPKGYDTMVGDARLSGGQRQRLALARALVREPQILILDEATSALDVTTEAAVQASLRDYLQERKATCLVIAHRLSTVADADKIVVLEEGHVAEEGKHKQLLKQKGAYWRLVQGGQL